MKTNIEIRSFFKGLGLLLGMVLGLALAHAQTQSASNGPAIQVIAAGQKSVSNFNDIDGVVEAVMQSTLSSQIAGRVLSLNVKAGDRVKAGQVLATIDDRETQTGVLRSQAQLQQSDAELRQLQIALKRTQDLKAQGFVSAAALDLAEAQYKAAQAGRDSAGATTQQAKVAQSYSKITAPYDAWVLETSAQAGDLALPGKPLMTVYAPQPMRVVMQWPASEKNSLPKLQDIQIQMGTETVKPVAMQVMPNADGVSQTIGIKLDLPRTGVALQAAPGMQVRVRTAGISQAKGLVPASAILRRGEITAVYVAQGNGFAMKLVRLGADHGSAGVEIWAGLKEGELIAVDAIQAGMKGAHVAR
ncbi:MAG: efflux RND transporter periplasmic adaptor subunit [Betaproteobacteria bacterium]|nr:efflux RND transporter periplasmic adaptor subunit [Betaproteobacteria bacterium]